MAINYKITKVKNLKGQEGTVYCHAVAVKTSNYEFDELAEDITQSTTVTKADAVAVHRSRDRSPLSIRKRGCIP